MRKCSGMIERKCRGREKVQWNDREKVQRKRESAELQWEKKRESRLFP